MNVTDPRYPIGKFETPETITYEMLDAAIMTIETLPAKLNSVVNDLEPEQLDTPYREGGWTVRQVVHHIADSHMNAVTRVKLALTEDNPTIKPYEEAEWAKLPDMEMPVDISLQLLASLHARWVYLLSGLNEDQWKRTLVHPDGNRVLSVEVVTLMYQWHSDHHLAHITELRKAKGW